MWVQDTPIEHKQFINPANMIQGLLSTSNLPCNCTSHSEQQQSSQQTINNEIKSIQKQISNIKIQISQAEKLRKIRDNLYLQLDSLRSEREQIQNQIQTVATHEHTQTVKYAGYKQMNDRLRRRIAEVRQYIQKMTFQNKRLEEGLVVQAYSQQQQYSFRRTLSPQPVFQAKKAENNVESLIAKLHSKQQQAWRRIRKQEEEIERRNQHARDRFSQTFTYYSPKNRNRQIY